MSKPAHLFALLERSAAQWPDNPALVHGDRIFANFSQMHDDVLKLAGALAGAAAPGERVLIAGKNRPEIIVLMFACWAAGLAVVPVNAKLHPRELAEIAHNCMPRWAFVDSQFAGALEGMDCRVVTFGSEAFTALVAHAPAVSAAPAADALAWLFYTSGTTGKPKGAMLSHANLLAMAQAHWADVDDPAPGTSLLHAAPLSHGSGLYVLPYLARGAAQVVPASGQFDPAEVLALCRTWPGAAMFLAPTMVQRLCDAVEAQGSAAEGLRLVVYGGGPMYVADMRRALALLGPRFAQIYGQGESPMTITGLAAADHAGASDAVLGSVGRARSTMAVRVVDADGKVLPPGTPGEIIVNGPSVMAGYWNLPKASAATLRQGWLWTGDIGAFDADGLLTLMDRSKDVIISGGSNIYPREVEEVLLAHPSVTEACVLGEPDSEWGEVVVAHLAASAGCTIDSTTLDAHCLAHIARFKRPKRYVVHASLPKNANGKILKRELRES